jgi:hypothetical protein
VSVTCHLGGESTVKWTGMPDRPIISTDWVAKKGGGRVQGVSSRKVPRSGSLSEKTPAHVNDNYQYYSTWGLLGLANALHHYADCR